MTQMQGISVSCGYALGGAFHYRPFLPEISKLNLVPGMEKEALEQYENAFKLAEAELAELSGESQSKERANIFTAHLDILHDFVIDGEIRELIRSQLYPADRAISQVYESYASIIASSRDSIIREKSADIRDVRLRLLRCLSGEPEAKLDSLARPVILLAAELSPSEAASLDPKLVLAIVMEAGGPTSHCAIISRALGIPALFGVTGALSAVTPGQTLIVDGEKGLLILDSDEAQRQAYIKKRECFVCRCAEAAAYLRAKSETADGTALQIQLNIGSAEELEGAACCDGVGLFRTEYLLMGRNSVPDEDEQLKAYKRVLLAFGEKPVIIRTFDLGGDKQPAFLPSALEDNPSLGLRGLRFGFANMDIFNTQLRALLRASVYGQLWIMFPMAATIEDIRQAKQAAEQAKAELSRQGLAFDPEVKLGIVIELPSIALLADKAALEVDFACIGTNDLCQYLFAADRTNPDVAGYCRGWHPALLRLIRQLVPAFTEKGKPLGVCGEMCACPMGAILLLGLGLRRFSMCFAVLPSIKKLLGQITLAEAVRFADEACELNGRDEVEALFHERFPGLLPMT